MSLGIIRHHDIERNSAAYLGGLSDGRHIATHVPASEDSGPYRW